MVRGDDVAALQHGLGSRGFHAGRVDGIFGPMTSAALAEFQRNLGLPPDGICGPDTVAALGRLGRRSADTLVGLVREAETHRRRLRELGLFRVAVARDAGLEVLGEAAARELTVLGVTSFAIDVPESSTQAQLANRLRTDAFVGFSAQERSAPLSGVATSDRDTVIAFYRTPGYDSVRGRSLAEHVVRALESACAVGLRWVSLRETSMPAVQVFVPRAHVVERVPEVAVAVAHAVADWWMDEEI